MNEHEQSLVERLIETMQSLIESNRVQAEAISALADAMAAQVELDDDEEPAAPRRYLDGTPLIE